MFVPFSHGWNEVCEDFFVSGRQLLACFHSQFLSQILISVINTLFFFEVLKAICNVGDPEEKIRICG